jgi:DNA invertase Pin-like site-specific DNA recombinase
VTRAFSYTRLSSGHQARGDGGRRQIDRAEAYAKSQGLTLDRSFDLNDHGLSGYDGSNVERGRLGKFIEAVRAGRIDKGSVLIVESLDRLSRARARQSLRQFLELLDSGVTITTLIDGRTYTEQSDHADLMVSLGVMQRAHDESRTKSDRGLAVWAHKRKNISTRILTKTCPGWLKPKADQSGFDLVKSRVEVVKRIFADATQRGMGVSSIMRRFNREKVPTFRSAKAWHAGYIYKILRSRAVLGEFAPNSNGKGTETVLGYYPRIISDEIFYRAAAALEKRRQAGGGRKGAAISNLFTKLAFCGVCGHRIAMKGGRRGGKVLICNGVERGLTCRSVTWRYEQFEESALRFLRELDLQSLTGDASSQDERRQAEDELRATDGRLIETVRRRDRAFELLLGDEPTDYLKGRLRGLDVEVAALEKQLVLLRDKLNVITHDSQAFVQGKAEISTMIKQIQSGGDETYALRSALSARLRDLVDKIRVWGYGTLANDKGYAAPDSRFFEVRFRDGSARLVACGASGDTWTASKAPWPSKDRPSKGLSGEFVGD